MLRHLGVTVLRLRVIRVFTLLLLLGLLTKVLGDRGVYGIVFKKSSDSVLRLVRLWLGAFETRFNFSWIAIIRKMTRNSFIVLLHLNILAYTKTCKGLDGLDVVNGRSLWPILCMSREFQSSEFATLLVELLLGDPGSPEATLAPSCFESPRSSFRPPRWEARAPAFRELLAASAPARCSSTRRREAHGWTDIRACWLPSDAQKKK